MLYKLACYLLLFILLISLYLQSEISDIEYRELYIFIQQNEKARDLAEYYFTDNKISQHEYNRIMKLNKINNKKVFTHSLYTKYDYISKRSEN